MYRFFTSLVKFVPSYFILVIEIVNESVFLISVSASFLVEYRDKTDFCILTFHPATLLYYYIISNSFFLVES